MWMVCTGFFATVSDLSVEDTVTGYLLPVCATSAKVIKFLKSFEVI